MAHFDTITLAFFSLLIATALAAKNPAFDNDDDDDGKSTPASPASSPAISPSAAEDLNYLNTIPPQERKYLDNCSKRMSQKCGDEVVEGMLGKAEVSDDCCTELVRMGKKCHVHLVKLLVEFPDFKYRAAKIKETSKKIWYGCRDVAAPPPKSK